LRELLMIPDVHQQFEQSANGVTRFGLTRSAIGNIKVAFPSIERQQHIAQVARTSEQIETNLGKYISALRQQKQALMQQLLTGQVRVNVAEKPVPFA
jgi:type I restriction enzyme S subunit